MFTTQLLVAALFSTALAQTGQEDFEFATVEDRTITLEFAEPGGTPLADLVAFAQTVVGVPLDYDERDLKDVALTVHGAKSLDRADFWYYFQALLRAHDFIVVPYGNVLAPNQRVSGPDTGFFAIRPSAGGAGGKSRPGYIKSQARVVTPDELKDFRHDVGIVLTTSFMLEHVNVQEAANMLQTYFTDPMLESVRAVSNSNSLVVTGFAQTLCGLQELIELIDVEPAAPERELKRVVLEYAVADEVKPVIVRMIASEAETVDPRQPRAAGTASSPPPPALEVDPRTNSLLILATGPMHERVSRLIEKLDVATVSTGETIVLPLKNAAASDLAQTLNAWIRATGAVTVSVVAHEASNALLITASEKQLPAVRKLVEQLDIPSRQAAAGGELKVGLF